MANYRALLIKQGNQTPDHRLMQSWLVRLLFGQVTALKKTALPAPTLQRTQRD